MGEVELVSVAPLHERVHVFQGDDLPVIEAKVSVGSLNRACIIKDVFECYLCSCIIEPVLVISSGRLTLPEVVLQFLSLSGICLWIYTLGDTFCYNDTAHAHKFSTFEKELDSDIERFKFAQFRLRNLESKSRVGLHAGNFFMDVALWFQLISITVDLFSKHFRNVIGDVVQPDVVHAYVIVLLWLWLHHRCISATDWTGCYLLSLICPSRALLPIEWVLPLLDAFDVICDIHDLEEWVRFLKAFKRVSITIDN